MNPLDDSEIIKKLDKGGMYDRIYDFPSQLEDALKRTRDVPIPDRDRNDVSSIIVAGLGGSAIGGDLVRSYLADRLNMPFLICRNYILPGFVDSSSLVFVSSYSGNTEETLSAFQDASGKGARLICVTSGGEVGKIASQRKIPWVSLPKGFQPRAALGYSFVPVLAMLEKLGLVESEEANIKQAGDFLARNRGK